MPNDNYKIQLVFEALNNANLVFNDLKRQLKDTEDTTKKTGAGLSDMFGQLKEHWIGVTAAVAGVAIAVNKGFEYMELGAKAEQAEAAFRSVAAASNENADQIIEDMKRAAAGTVDDSDIMQKAVKGMVQGLSGDKLIKIMEAARAAAIVSGQSVSQAYEAITDAIANKMPRSLIQYGLVTKEQMKLVNEAMSLGITDIDVYAIAMENAAKQQNKLADAQIEHAEKMQRWKAIFNDVKETIGKGIFWIVDNVIGRLFNVIANVSATIADLFARIGSLWDWMTSGFKGGVAELTKQMAIADEAFAGQIKENNAKYGGSDKTNLPQKPSPVGKGITQELKDAIAAAKSTETLGPDRGTLKDWEETQAMLAKEAAAWKAAEEAAVSYGLYLVDLAEQERSISKAEAVEKRIELNKQMLAIQEEYLTKVDRLKDPAGWYTQQQAIIKTRQELLALNRQMKEQTGSFAEGFKDAFNQYIYDAKTSFQEGVKLAQDAAQAMEQAFSDFFFDVFTGKLKHLSDYLKSFFEAVARAMANMMAQKTSVAIASGIANAWGSGSSSTMTNGSTGAGDLAAVGHKGGYIMHAGGLVPRFHIGGLASDERPIIAQTGEGILSRKGMAAFDLMNQGGDIGGKGVSVVVNVENKTSQPANAKVSDVRYDHQAKAFVVGVIMSDLEYGGPIRSGISGMR
ncbi:MAG: hypothetical protein M0R70_12595 [Nitrospirae bacterium]|nr:hypothetical protein [Nitrospirota bacterium]